MLVPLPSSPNRGGMSVPSRLHPLFILEILRVGRLALLSGLARLLRASAVAVVLKTNHK